MQSPAGSTLSLFQHVVNCLHSAESVKALKCVHLVCLSVCLVSFWLGSGVQALSVGERPYPLQDALISFAQAEPEGLPDAQRTVPT